MNSKMILKLKHLLIVFKRRFGQLFHYCEYLCAKFYVFITRKNNDNVWLISERGSDARDNAYVFYKYVKSNHPEINVKYVITKDSFDLKRVDLSDVVWHGSWENYILFVSAGKLISTHTYGYSPDFQLFSNIDKRGLVNVPGKKVYLTHFLMDGRTFTWNKKVRNLDLYLCSSACDYYHILESSDYGETIVRLIGTPRMDNLYNNRDVPTNNVILVMPTWRLPFTKMSRDEFLLSSYYQNYQQLINDKRILDYLHAKGIKMIFYPHIEVQKFIDCFSSESSDVIIGDATKFVVEDLLLTTKFMITDYSSVHLDFALLRKKIAYFQFDREDEFRDRPWGSHFLYERDGFGPLFLDLNSLVEYVISQENLDFDEKYEKRITKAFPIFDNKNCQRVFEAISDL